MAERKGRSGKGIAGRQKRAGLPRAGGARNDGVGPEARLQANKHRDVQVARTGGRKLFDEERRGVFLEWFAATANVSLAAEQAGINYKTAFRHRMNDADFAADWDRALEQGVARLKAKLLESKAAPRRGIDGDLDAPEMADVDPQIGLAILRESERRLAGWPKAGAAPRVATNAEVRESLAGRLRAFRARVRAERAGRSAETPPRDGEGDRREAGVEGAPNVAASRESELPPPNPGPLHHPTDGPPPRAGEDIQ